MWWKLFFWFYFVVTLLGSIILLLEFSSLTIYDFYGVIFGFLILFVLYGIAYKPELLKQNYWKIIFIILIFMFAEELIELFILPKDLISNLLGGSSMLEYGAGVGVGERLIAWSLGLPSLYAAYRLSSK